MFVTGLTATAQGFVPAETVLVKLLAPLMTVTFLLPLLAHVDQVGNRVGCDGIGRRSSGYVRDDAVVCAVDYCHVVSPLVGDVDQVPLLAPLITVTLLLFAFTT